MPTAYVPNAPCVEVCESPQVTISPGCDAELGPDHVHDALLRMLQTVVIFDVVGAGILREQIEHVAHFGIGDGGRALRAIARRHVMVGGRECLPRLAHLEAFRGERAERVERSFVHEVAVDVQQRFARAALDDYVAGPDLFEHGLRHGAISCRQSKA